MSLTIGGRHERHMMRQRGAGARPITATFGFVFNAGPIKLPQSLPPDPPNPTHAPPPAQLCPESDQPLDTPNPIQDVKKQKKKRVEVEEEELAWFSRRSKKTTVADTTLPKGTEEIETYTMPAESGPMSIDPPVETKATKRKPASKKTAPATKPRQKRPVKEKTKDQQHQSEPPEDSLPENQQSSKENPQSKAVTSVKPRSRKPAPLPNEDEEDELSNDSLQNIITPASTASKKRKADTISREGFYPETQGSRKSSKPVPRKKAVPRGKKTSTEEPQPVLQENAESLHTTVREPLETHKTEERYAERPSSKVTRKRKVPTKPARKAGEGETDQAASDILKKEAAEDKSESRRSVDETAQPPKKRKVVRKKTVTACELHEQQAKEKSTALPDAASESPVREKPRAIKKLVKRVKNVDQDEKTGAEALDVSLGTSHEESKPAIVERTVRHERRLALEERHSNSSPQKVLTDTSIQVSVEKPKRVQTRVARRQPTKIGASDTKERTAADCMPEPTDETAVTSERPQPSIKSASAKPTRHGTKSKKPEVIVHEDDKERQPKSRSLPSSKASKMDSEDIDVALFDTETPALVIKKAPSGLKRSFNDDSELDLDQMLNGIAAIASNGISAPPKAAKPSRITKRKVAV